MLGFPSQGHAVVAIFAICGTAACLKALDLAGRVRWQPRVRKRRVVRSALGVAALAWGIGFALTGVVVRGGSGIAFDGASDGLALLWIVAGTFGSFLTLNRRGGRRPLAIAALVFALGLLGGLATMSGAPTSLFTGLGTWSGVGFLIAYLGSAITLWLGFRRAEGMSRIASGLFLGLTMVGIEYALVRGAPAALGLPEVSGDSDPALLSLGFLIAALLILFAASVTNMLDRRFSVLKDREASGLRRSEERIRERYRLTPLPLLALGVDGTVEQVSEAWLDLLGYSRQEVLDRPLSAFLTEEARRRGDLDWDRVCASDAVFDVQTRLVASNGEVRDVVVSLRRECDAVGRVTGALGGLVDITARIQAEAALRQAQKIEAIGQLTGGVAHDFNNLLSVVMGNLEMIAKRLPDDPRMKRQVDSALQATQRGASLTERMLSFARRQDLMPEAVDIGRLVAGMSDLLKNAVGTQVSIVQDFPSGTPAAMVDGNQLELSLINLAVNARDAMPEGGTLVIQAREDVVGPGHPQGVKPGRYVVLSVSDSGIGMDEATLARAREPFFTTKGIGKGTGLGLSMVHGVAEQSGGALVLRSTVGSGTVAEIYLPESEHPAATMDEAVPDASPTGMARDRLRILVVDDDLLVRSNVTDQLEELGHVVVQVGSGPEGLAAFQADPGFDVILTDHAMPYMTGLQFAALVREIVPLQPIILASGYAEIPEGTKLNLPRLRKPYSQAALARMLAEVVPAARPRPQSGHVLPFRQRQSL